MLKKIIAFLFIIIAVGILFIYWYFPHNSVDFQSFRSTNTNFSTGYSNNQLQFYSNMRYSDKRISYLIEDCTLQKKEDMLTAFDILSKATVLEFYSSSNPEIFITCDSKKKLEKNIFIAGEGGPSNITVSGDYNLILHGQILLFEQSECEKPNVAIHELLHALGFDHSTNPKNIMYNFSRCNQEIGSDILEKINKLYSVSSLPDLTFEEIQASVSGRYLNTNFSVRNIGLKQSPASVINIKSQDKIIKTLDLEILEPGHGLIITLTNIDTKLTIGEFLDFEIKTDFEELNKQNNKITLTIKN